MEMFLRSAMCEVWLILLRVLMVVCTLSCREDVCGGGTECGATVPGARACATEVET
jgi:hypothetical protein